MVELNADSVGYSEPMEEDVFSNFGLDTGDLASLSGESLVEPPESDVTEDAQDIAFPADEISLKGGSGESGEGEEPGE